jgi:hypothetical protein
MCPILRIRGGSCAARGTRPTRYARWRRYKVLEPRRPTRRQRWRWRPCWRFMPRAEPCRTALERCAVAANLRAVERASSWLQLREGGFLEGEVCVAHARRACLRASSTAPPTIAVMCLQRRRYRVACAVGKLAGVAVTKQASNDRYGPSAIGRGGVALTITVAVSVPTIRGVAKPVAVGSIRGVGIPVAVGNIRGVGIPVAAIRCCRAKSQAGTDASCDSGSPPSAAAPSPAPAGRGGRDCGGKNYAFSQTLL